MPTLQEAVGQDPTTDVSQDEMSDRRPSSITVIEMTEASPSLTHEGYPDAPSMNIVSRQHSDMPQSLKPKKSADSLPVHISSPTSGPYVPQVHPSIFRRTPHHDDDENTRRLHSMPNLSGPSHQNIDIRYDTEPFRTNNSSIVSLPESFRRLRLDDRSPFYDSDRRKRLCDAVYGPGIANPPIAIYAEWLDWQTSGNVERSDNYVHHIDLLGNFLEARKPGEEARIDDFIEVVSKTPGWPPWAGLDEKVSAWHVLATTLQIPIYVPIKKSCTTFEDQVREMYPPMLANLTPKKFKTTLSDILNSGLVVKPTDFFFEHLQIVEGETTVNIFFVNGVSAHWSRLYDRNRAVKALGMDTLMMEIIASTFAIFEYNPFNKKAEELGLLVCNGPADYVSISSLFCDYQDVPPKLLAERAVALEDLIKNMVHRRPFWTNLLRDLRKQRREQPFAFWGSTFALFFGICAVIQTVASVWALVAPQQSNTPQTLQGTATNGLKVSNTPWSSCINKDDPNASLKDDVVMSCLFRIDFA